MSSRGAPVRSQYPPAREWDVAPAFTGRAWLTRTANRQTRAATRLPALIRPFPSLRDPYAGRYLRPASESQVQRLSFSFVGCAKVTEPSAAEQPSEEAHDRSPQGPQAQPDAFHRARG